LKHTMSTNTATPSPKTTTYLLAGDIGGTYSRLGLYGTCQREGMTPLQQQLSYKEFVNEEHLVATVSGGEDILPIDTWFEQKILLPFVQHCWIPTTSTPTTTCPPLLSLSPIQDSVIVVCLAIAGPVKNNQVQVSRHKALELNGHHIVQRCRSSPSNPYLSAIVECYIINDFVAQGYGCLTLDTTTMQDVLELIPGSRDKKDPTGPMICIGAGTGLGTCYLTSTTTTTTTSPSLLLPNIHEFHPWYMCLPSEFGQIGWTPRTEQDVEVWRYLQTKFHSPHHVTLEEVVSGTGIANCYECFASLYPAKINDTVHRQVQQENALKGMVVAENTTNCELCHMAMTTVMRYVRTS
jgi:glucokinase